MAVNLYLHELSSQEESNQAPCMPFPPTPMPLQNSDLPETAAQPPEDHDVDSPNKNLHAVDLNEASVKQPLDNSIPSNSQKSWVRVFPSDSPSFNKVSSRPPATLQNSDTFQAPAKTLNKLFDDTYAHTSAQCSSVTKATPENSVKTPPDISANQTSDTPPPSRSRVLNMVANIFSTDLHAPGETSKLSKESNQAPCMPFPQTPTPLQNSDLPQIASRAPADYDVDDSPNRNLHAVDLNETYVNQPLGISIPLKSRKSWVRVYPSDPSCPEEASSRPPSTLQNSKTTQSPIKISNKPFDATYAHTSAQRSSVTKATPENSVKTPPDISANQTSDTPTPSRSRVLNMVANIFSPDIHAPVEASKLSPNLPCQYVGMPSLPMPMRLQNSNIPSPLLPEIASRPLGDHTFGEKPVLKRYAYANSSLTSGVNESLHSQDLNESCMNRPLDNLISSNSRKSWVRVFPSDLSSSDEVSSRPPSNLQNSDISPANAKTSTKHFDATNAHTYAQSSSDPTSTPENAIQTHTDLSANQMSDKPTPTRSNVLNMVANIFSPEHYVPGEAQKLLPNRLFPSTLQKSNTFPNCVTTSTQPFALTSGHTSAQSSILPITTPENAVQTRTDLSSDQTSDNPTPSRSRVLNMVANIFSPDLNSQMESGRPHIVSNKTLLRRYSPLTHESYLSPRPPPVQQQACDAPRHTGPHSAMPTTMDSTVSVSSLHEIQTPEYMFSSDIIEEEIDQPINHNSAMETDTLKEQNHSLQRKVEYRKQTLFCKVCMQVPVSHLVLPCGQIEVCLTCADCRLLIREMMRERLESESDDEFPEQPPSWNTAD